MSDGFVGVEVEGVLFRPGLSVPIVAGDESPTSVVPMDPTLEKEDEHTLRHEELRTVQCPK